MGLRAFDRLTRGECRQRGHAKVDADNRLRLRHRLHGVRLDQEGHEPTPGLAGYRGALQRPGEPDLLAHPHPTDDRQLDPLAADAECSGLVGGTKGRLVFLALEPRIRTALLEEAAECCAEIDDRLLRCALRDIEHPRELLALERIELLPKRHFGRLTARLVLVLPFA